MFVAELGRGDVVRLTAGSLLTGLFGPWNPGGNALCNPRAGASLQTSAIMLLDLTRLFQYGTKYVAIRPEKVVSAVADIADIAAA